MRPMNNDEGTYGFRQNFDVDKNNQWLFGKLNKTFFQIKT